MDERTFHFSSRMDPGLLRPQLWEKAGWCGLSLSVHSHPNIHPPRIGLIFSDRHAATELFLALVTRVGPKDPHRRVRMAIIEGTFPIAPQKTYAATFGTHIEYTLREPIREEVPGKPWKVITPRACLHGKIETFEPLKRSFQFTGRVVLYPKGLKEAFDPNVPLAVETDGLVFRRSEEIRLGEGDPDEGAMADVG